MIPTAYGGRMHARFAPVRDCFHDLFAAGRETGAGLSIWYDGEPVVDLVGSPGWPAGHPGQRLLGREAGGRALPADAGRPGAVPAVNLHATAAGLARLYAGLLADGTLDGVRLFSADLVAEATRVQYDGPDLVLDRRAYWTLGMQREPDGSWGMGGIGGSSAWADPERGYTFAYATARLAEHDRVDELVEALHSCL